MSTQMRIHPKYIHICTQACMHANTYTLEHTHIKRWKLFKGEVEKRQFEIATHSFN